MLWIAISFDAAVDVFGEIRVEGCFNGQPTWSSRCKNVGLTVLKIIIRCPLCCGHRSQGAKIDRSRVNATRNPFLSTVKCLD